MKTLGLPLQPKLHNIVLCSPTQLPNFEDSSLYIVASIQICNIGGIVPVSYDVFKFCKGSSVPVY